MERNILVLLSMLVCFALAQDDLNEILEDIEEADREEQLLLSAGLLGKTILGTTLAKGFGSLAQGFGGIKSGIGGKTAGIGGLTGGILGGVGGLKGKKPCGKKGCGKPGIQIVEDRNDIDPLLLTLLIANLNARSSSHSAAQSAAEAAASVAAHLSAHSSAQAAVNAGQGQGQKQNSSPKITNVLINDGSETDIDVDLRFCINFCRSSDDIGTCVMSCRKAVTNPGPVSPVKPGPKSGNGGNKPTITCSEFCRDNNALPDDVETSCVTKCNEARREPNIVAKLEFCNTFCGGGSTKTNSIRCQNDCSNLMSLRVPSQLPTFDTVEPTGNVFNFERLRPRIIPGRPCRRICSATSSPFGRRRCLNRCRRILLPLVTSLNTLGPQGQQSTFCQLFPHHSHCTGIEDDREEQNFCQLFPHHSHCTGIEDDREEQNSLEELIDFGPRELQYCPWCEHLPVGARRTRCVLTYC